MNTISISRRRFAQLLGAGAATAVIRPAFSFATEPVPKSTVQGIVRLSANGAEVVKVPLTGTFSHDLPKMAAGAKEGLIYVCNPNNPTASITPKNEVRDFITKTPRQTMILVDEAYFHYADSPDYESVIPLVTDHPNLIVSRTFSKIYVIAGLRLGSSV